MSITIREANPTDEDTIVRFNLAMAWETESKRLDPAAVELGVRAVLHDQGKGFYTIAERAGEIVGQAMVTFEWSDWRNGWFWWLQSVYVKHDARRIGVFRSLFDYLRSKASSDRNVVGIRLYVENDNRGAQEVYRKLGMKTESFSLCSLMLSPPIG